MRRRSVRRRPFKKLSRKGRRLRGMTAVMPGGAYPGGSFTAFGTRRGSRLGPLGKRARGYTGMTRRVKQRRFVDSSGYLQLQKYAFRKKLAKWTLNKAVRAVTQHYDFIWRATQKLAGNGKLWMDNYYVGTGATTQTYRPIYLVDLTSANTNGGQGQPVWGLRRIQSASLPQYDLVPIIGLDNQGVNSTYWTDFYSGGQVSNYKLTEKSILKWSEIRLDLWGSVTQPCVYTLTLCQFDEAIFPLDPGSTSLVARQAVDFWDDLSGKLIFNENLRKPPNGNFRNMIKVIDRKQFIINPTATYESDQDPHCKVVRLFYRHNRMVNFAWQTRVPKTHLDGVDPASAVTFDTTYGSEVYTTPQVKARVFLMITCGNFRGTQSGSAQSKNDTGSINMSVLNRWADI